MFEYEPMTEQECNQERGFSLLEPGIYDFVVDQCKQKISSSGNPMLEIQLKVWDKSGKDYRVFDYLVATKKMMWKIRHFSESVGLLKEYEQKKLCPDLIIHKSGKADIIFVQGKQKPEGGYYPDKNGVEDYVMTDKGAHKAPLSKSEEFDDSIPF